MEGRKDRKDNQSFREDRIHTNYLDYMLFATASFVPKISTLAIHLTVLMKCIDVAQKHQSRGNEVAG